MPARSWRMLNGVWVPVMTSRRPSTHWALVACGSIGTCAAAGVWKTSSMMTSASANASARAVVGVVQVGDHGRLVAALQPGRADAEAVADVGAVLRAHVEVRRVATRRCGAGRAPAECVSRERLHLVVHRRALLVLDLDQEAATRAAFSVGATTAAIASPTNLGSRVRTIWSRDLAAEAGRSSTSSGVMTMTSSSSERGVDGDHSPGRDAGADDAQVPLAGDAAVGRVADAGGDAGVDADRGSSWRRAACVPWRSGAVGHGPTAIRARRTSTPTTRRR